MVAAAKDGIEGMKKSVWMGAFFMPGAFLTVRLIHYVNLDGNQPTATATATATASAHLAARSSSRSPASPSWIARVSSHARSLRLSFRRFTHMIVLSVLYNHRRPSRPLPRS